MCGLKMRLHEGEAWLLFPSALAGQSWVPESCCLRIFGVRCCNEPGLEKFRFDVTAPRQPLREMFSVTI